jgi:predicted RNA-binding Zn ribbon-like protein
MVTHSVVKGTNMRLLERPIAVAKLVGGCLCLDFVNTCGGRSENGSVIDDRLLEYADLLAWATRATLESGGAAIKMVHEAGRDPGAAARIHERAIALREACYRMASGVIHKKPPSPADLAVLNREWAEALRHKTLAAGTPCLQFKWTSDALDRPLWAVAESAVQLLMSPDAARLRECGGADCGWLFEDVSRNHSRQWCDMEMCGNRAKVRRFRDRKKEE